MGEIVCRARAFETDLVVVEFDEQQRDLQSSSIVPVPDADEEIWNALVLGVRDYARKCGFFKVVIGLSGGLIHHLWQRSPLLHWEQPMSWVY